MNFKNKLSRSEISHIAQLKKAQDTISAQIKQQGRQNHEDDAENNPYDQIKMRPSTPMYKSDFQYQASVCLLSDGIGEGDFVRRKADGDLRSLERSLALILT